MALLTTLQALQEWSATQAPSTWPARVGALASGALAAAFATLLVRAWLRRRWYRAEGVLGEAELEHLRGELAAAERRTAGEIQVVVLERSDRHPGAAWLAALVLALLGGLALAPVLAPVEPLLLLAAQLFLAACGFLAARALPDVQRLFLSDASERGAAEEQAFQEFHRYGLHRTSGRTGVLLFVSLLEHRAVVLGDEGIDAKVGPDAWARTAEAMLADIRGGSLARGLEAGIHSAAEVLAAHVPRAEGDVNELPDRIVVRRE